MTGLNGYKREPLPKQTLLLLHPGGVMHSVWLPYMRAWAAGYQIVAPDLYALNVESFSTKLLAEALIKDLNGQADPVIIIGSSLGANVALELAIQQPSLVKCLVLDSPQAGGEPVPPIARKLVAGFNRIAPLIPNSLFVRLLMRQFNAYTPEDREAIRRELYSLGVRGFLKAIQATFDHNVRAHLIQIQVPVLLTNGATDMALPESKKLLHNLPQAEQFVIEKAGHSAFLSQHSAFIEKVNAFLSAHA